VGRAQLALANESAAAVSWAREAWNCAGPRATRSGPLTALNLLADAGLQAGRIEQAEADAAEALATARYAGNGWNEDTPWHPGEAGRAAREDAEAKDLVSGWP